jgi:hypothetical protein
MFILDSLFLSGFRWVLDTVRTAAEAELDDDTALREELLAAEMRREMGEISDDEFAEIEADLLARIRAIKERREGGSGPIAFGQGDEGGASEFQVEATVSGDFHEPAAASNELPAADSGTAIVGPAFPEERPGLRVRGSGPRASTTRRKRRRGPTTR